MTDSSEQTARKSKAVRALAHHSRTRLGEERERGQHHQGGRRVEGLPDPQADHRLAGAAGHDQLAAVALLEALEDILDGGLLVRSRRLLGERLGPEFIGMRRPVEFGFGKLR